MSEEFYNLNEYIIDYINDFDSQNEIDKEFFINHILSQHAGKNFDYIYVRNLVYKRCCQLLPTYENIEDIFFEEKLKIAKLIKITKKKYMSWKGFYDTLIGHVYKRFMPKYEKKLKEMILKYISKNKNSASDLNMGLYIKSD